MNTSKFFENQRNSPRHHLPSSSSSFQFTSMELYPRMRGTEFYREPPIPEEYQSRDFEHPKNLNLVQEKSPSTIKENRHLKIVPPKTSDMRVNRNSYFS